MKKPLMLLTLALIIILKNAHAQVNLNSGLIMYLPFSGNAIDAAGNNTGIVSNAALTTDEHGNANSAYYFNGVNSYIRIPHDPSLNPGVFTISAKVNMQGFWVGRCYNNMIICKGTDRSYGSYSLRATQTLADDCYIYDTLSQNYRCDVQTINCPVSTMNNLPHITTNSGWDCLIGTYDGDSVKMYVNGRLRYAYRETGLGTNTSDLYIGQSSIFANELFSFKGKIDEVRMYNRVLNEDERKALCAFIPTSISKISNMEKPVLFPNPAKNNLSVQFQLRYADDVSIVVTDIAARNMIVLQDQYSAGRQSKNIDISSLSSGIYLIKITANGSETVQKLIKE